MNSSSAWFALYTKPFWEKKVAGLISDLGFEAYCPMQKHVRQWSDRKKVIATPLFKSYVFVRTDAKGMSLVKQVYGVVSVVSFLGKPAVIRDEEIDIIKRFNNEYRDIEVKKVEVSVNDRIRVTGGPLMNMRGSVVRVHNKTVEVYLPSFGYVLTANIDKQNIEKESMESVQPHPAIK